MILSFYLVLILFEFCSFYDIIPVRNFEKKVLNFNSSGFIIFSYYISGSPNLTTYYIQIRQTYITSISYLYFYQYEDASQIFQDSNGKFINYINSYSMTPTFQRDFISIIDTFYYNKTYIFVVKSDDYFDSNLALSFYSTEEFVNINNFVQGQIAASYRQILNYNFHIPLGHKKYLLFVNHGSLEPNITIIDNNKKIVLNEIFFYGESYLELEEINSYDIYFKYSQFKSAENKIFYFYLAQSKYTKIFPVEMNTEYFQRFFTFEGLKLLLDLSSINKGNIIWLNYNKEWAGRNYYKVYSYNTDDKEVLENTKGKELTLTTNYSYCSGYICKYSFHKDSDDIKMAVIDVEDFYKYSEIYLDIKYGFPERYITQKVYFSFLIGICLSIPNIIIQSIVCSREKLCAFKYKCTFIMDFVLHIAYGCLICVLSYLGGKPSLIIAYVFLGLYGFGLFINFILICCEVQAMFTGIICLFKKMRNLRTFKEAFNERRKLPPQIIVSDESRYNKTNENNHEYEYCSWEDNTNFELKVDYNVDIIECQFNFEIKIDDSTKEDLDSFKKSFENNEKPTNNGDHKNKTY